LCFLIESTIIQANSGLTMSGIQSNEVNAICYGASAWLAVHCNDIGQDNLTVKGIKFSIQRNGT